MGRVSILSHPAYHFAGQEFTESRVQDPSLQYAAPGQPVDELALAEIKSAILAKLRLTIGKDAAMATKHDWYKAAALETLIQATRSAAAMISIESLSIATFMARASPRLI